MKKPISKVLRYGVKVLVFSVFGLMIGKIPLPSKDFGVVKNTEANKVLSNYRNNKSLIEHIGAIFVLSSRAVKVEDNPEPCTVNKMVEPPISLSRYKVTVSRYTFFKFPIGSIEFTCDGNWSRV